MQMFWVDSVVTRLVSAIPRRRELVAQWRCCVTSQKTCMFSKCVVITSNFAHIWQSHVFGNAKLNNWKLCRVNLINPTEEYTITSFTISTENEFQRSK